MQNDRTGRGKCVISEGKVQRAVQAWRGVKGRGVLVNCWRRSSKAWPLPEGCYTGPGGREREATHSPDLTLITPYLAVNNSNFAQMMWRQTAATSLSYPPHVFQRHRSVESALHSPISSLLCCKHTLPWHKMYRCEFWKFNTKLDGRQLSPAATWAFHSTFECKFCFLLQTPNAQHLTQLRWEEKVKQGIFWTTYFRRAQSSWSIKSIFKRNQARGGGGDNSHGLFWTKRGWTQSKGSSSFYSGIWTKKIDFDFSTYLAKL